jgi:hypothetical protein
MARIGQAVLSAIRSSPASSTTRELVEATGFDRRDVVSAVDRLRRRGLVVGISLGRYQRSRDGDRVAAAQVEIKPGPKRPGIDAAGKRQPRPLRGDHAAGRGTLLERSWAALRQLKKATIPELLELAAGEESAAANVLGRYLRRLAAHGVVVELKRRVTGVAPTSNGFKQWTLLRDLGPKAPLYRPSTGELVDRNSGLAILPQEDARP